MSWWRWICNGLSCINNSSIPLQNVTFTPHHRVLVAGYRQCGCLIRASTLWWCPIFLSRVRFSPSSRTHILWQREIPQYQSRSANDCQCFDVTASRQINSSPRTSQSDGFMVPGKRKGLRLNDLVFFSHWKHKPCPKHPLYIKRNGSAYDFIVPLKVAWLDCFLYI